MAVTIEQVYPDTLSITHICDGEEVITGGKDGQVYVATFCDARAARDYVNVAQRLHLVVRGERSSSAKSPPKSGGQQ